MGEYNLSIKLVVMANIGVLWLKVGVYNDSRTLLACGQASYNILPDLSQDIKVNMGLVAKDLINSLHAVLCCIIMFNYPLQYLTEI